MGSHDQRLDRINRHIDQPDSDNLVEGPLCALVRELEAADCGAPWLAFLPGLTADHTLFDAQVAHFSGEGVSLVLIPGAGHNANVDNPEFVNDQIERFVFEVARSAPLALRHSARRL